MNTPAFLHLNRHREWFAASAAYGFSAKQDLLAQLLALNQQVARASRMAHPSPPRRPKKLPAAKVGRRIVSCPCLSRRMVGPNHGDC